MSAISAQGTAFIAKHEGFVSKAYRCPAGVLTIGYGFTMASKVFGQYWRARHGRTLQTGDTISKQEADDLLKRLIDAEYGAAVASKLGTLPQHQHDGASSVSFNCGTGSLVWKWATALKGGNTADAARRLRSTAITANGRQLAGLVRRRAEEAELIEHGRYAGVSEPKGASRDDQIREYQRMLVEVGYGLTIHGAHDIATDKAVRDFQRKHGLVVDGIVGPATRAALIRAIDARAGNGAAAGTGAVGGVTGGVADGQAAATDALLSAALWGVGLFAVALAIVFFIRYRGVLTGRRVPT